MRPTRIQRSGENALAVTWDDGHAGIYPFQVLRDNCPCATCIDDRDRGGTMLPVYEEGKYALAGVKQVGQYAIQITWKDGHDTGIYTFDILRALCRCEECTKEKPQE